MMNEPRAYFYNEDHARLATSSNLKSTKTYISGPLPHSSILHLSLNHLLAGRPTLEANSNAIVTNRRVLILSPDRASFSTALAQENDTNLKLLERELQNLLANVEIKYLTTSTALQYYLNTIYTHSSPYSHPAYAAYKSFNSASVQDPSYLDFNPTLVILHKPSHYLSEAIYESAGSEAYTSILALFLHRISSLCKPSPEIIVLDRDASTLALPIVPKNIVPISYRNSAQLGDPESRKLELDQFAEGMRCFDRIGFVERVAVLPSELPSRKRDYHFTVRDSKSHRKIPLNPDLGITFSLEEIGDVENEHERTSTRIAIEPN